MPLVGAQPASNPSLFLVGPNGQGLEVFYTNTTSVGSTFTVTAFVDTPDDSYFGWFGAFSFNQSQLNVVNIAFVANSSSQSAWTYDAGFYAPGTGYPPFMDLVIPPTYNNTAGTIGEPDGFGEAVVGPNTLPPNVIDLISITFKVMTVPSGSPGTSITGTVAWDWNVSLIASVIGYVGEMDESFGNFVYYITVPGAPPPPPQQPIFSPGLVQYNITFDQTAVGSDVTGNVVVIDGADFGYSSLPATFSWYDGSTHTFAFQSPLVAAPNSEKYLWTGTSGLSTLQTGSLTVTGSGNVTGNYETQYYLTVASAYDSPAPTSGWFDSGTIMNANVTSSVSGGPSTQYVCTGWTGTGSVPSSGSTNYASFTINAPSSITWNWKTQYQVTFNQTGVGTDFNGTVFTVDGANYTGSASPSFWWDSGSTHTYAYTSPIVLNQGVELYLWNSTTGLSTLQWGSITVAASGNITGNYVKKVHEVLLTNVAAKSWVYQGNTANINVTVSNVGDFPENVWVTLYCNITANESIDAYPVYLGAGQNYTLSCDWNTAGVPCLNYTLTAVATIPTGSNTLSDGNITVRIPGDVNGDGRVDLRDIALVARAFDSTPSSPNWNPAADINGDGVVNMKDITLVARYFGQHT